MSNDRAFEPTFIAGLAEPTLVWSTVMGPYSTVAFLWSAKLDAQLGVGPATLINNSTECCAKRPVSVPTRDVTWLFYADYATTLHLHGLRYARDGTRLDASPRLITSLALDDVQSVWVESSELIWHFQGLAFQRMRLDGTLLDATPVSVNVTGQAQQLAVASDGTQLVLVWTEYEQISVARLDGTTGALLAPVWTAVPRMAFSLDRAQAAKPSAVFDGTWFLITLDVPGPDGGQDLELLRLSPDGQQQTRGPLDVGPGDQSQDTLTVLSPGRTASVGLRRDPTRGIPRTSIRVVADVPVGAQCATALECSTGPCLSGVCCDADGGCVPIAPLDAGFTVQPDGGALDGGDTTGRRTVKVAVGCSAVDERGVLLVLLGWWARRRRATQ